MSLLNDPKGPKIVLVFKSFSPFLKVIEDFTKKELAVVKLNLIRWRHALFSIMLRKIH
jgi:hypothetical protein